MYRPWLPRFKPAELDFCNFTTNTICLDGQICVENSLAVGSDTGYKLFTINSDKLELIYEHKGQPAHLVERLFSSSLVAVVARNALRKLLVCHFKKGTEICNYSYGATILAVKLNRVRVVVCLEESLFIHNIKDMKVVHTIRDTPPNPSGLCCLSICSDHCYLAYPGSSTSGEVQIFDALNLHAKTMIAAHDSPLAALAFSPSGTKLATASEKGTVIRVFNVQDGTRLFEFRRGVKRYVSISSLTFSVCGTFLCSSSNTETVHVFKLEAPKELPQQSDDSWMSWMSKAVTASTNLLPTQVTDVFSQGRSFASVRLPVSGVKNSCAVTVIQQDVYLLVASRDGFLYVYKLDMTEGGESPLIRTHNLCGHYDISTATEGGSSSPKAIPRPIEPAGGSYAGVLKGNPPGIMSGTDSDRYNEMMAATESPPRGGFQFTDDNEFPPVSHSSG